MIATLNLIERRKSKGLAPNRHGQNVRRNIDVYFSSPEAFWMSNQCCLAWLMVPYFTGYVGKSNN